MGRKSGPCLVLWCEEFHIVWSFLESYSKLSSTHLLTRSDSQCSSCCSMKISMQRVCPLKYLPDPSLPVCLFRPQKPGFSKEEIWRNSLLPQSNFSFSRENNLSKTIQSNNNSNTDTIPPPVFISQCLSRGTGHFEGPLSFQKARHDCSLLNSHEAEWD